ncbi:MAG: hypothetical protein QT10_C0003G0037 [archaeon GW2011_AR19]|nr:MAG: hypothetical protein QT10_C0003G0037 [archaeon GW2011_AR19]
MESASQQTKKTDVEFYIQIGIVAALALIIVFAAGKIYGNPGANISGDAGITGATILSSDIIPTGVPAVYGSALGVSYDDVSASNPKLANEVIQKLSSYESKELNSEQMARYIKIGSAISCEYCCGADAIIFPNGQAACGCAHSYAMRGLAKYLLINNPEMSDYEILSELGKWKVLFFPGIHEQKAKVLEANGIDSTDYVNLASNLYRGAEQGQISSGGEMVGGC